MKVIFTTFPGDFGMLGAAVGGIPCLAIYLLASIVKDNGYEVDIIDPVYYGLTYDNNVNEIIRKHLTNKINREDIVCISCNTFNWAMAKRACEIIKMEIGAKIVLGGLHVSTFYKYVMNSTKVDVIIRGEGEEIIVKVIDYLMGKINAKNLAGISYRVEEQVYHNNGYNICNLDNINGDYYLPLFELLPNDTYILLPIETSRGCLFSCAFCSIPFRGNRRIFSTKVVQRQIDHCKLFRHKCISGTNEVNTVDDCFTHNPQRVRELINLFSVDKEKFKYRIEARINDLLEDDIFEYISSPAISSIQIGIECGYDEGLHLVGKGTDISRLYKCAKKICEFNLQNKTFFSFIIGFPWETESEINRTLDTIEDLCEKYNIVVSLNWLILLPSRLWDDREKYNINVQEDIFDTINWSCQEEIFYKTHPTINKSIYTKIERRITSLYAKGYSVLHSHITFNFHKKFEKVLN